MLPQSLLSCVALLIPFLPGTLSLNNGPTQSPKRGLVHIRSSTANTDLSKWTGGDLTWYYNYGPNATSELLSSKLQFVPMMFGTPGTGDPLFSDMVNTQVRAGRNITHVLGFNEPDRLYDVGGSNIRPDIAASIWKTQIAPLGGKNIKIGAPAVTGNSAGLVWLATFFQACDGGCPVDFYPIHYYGDFQGLASFIGQFQAAYGQRKNATLWVTEWGYPQMSLNETQVMFNTSMEYFDRLDWVERYSYFGSFRSSVSNVGPYPAMLNAEGKLTDIGSWYLGGSATGVVPNSASRYIISSVSLIFSLLCALVLA